MRLAALATCLLSLPVTAHENHGPYDAPGVVWQLVELDGAPFSATAQVEFPEIGRIEGRGPCNRFQGEMWAAYPWFQLDKIATTRRACPELEEEARFFNALEQMNLAETDGEFFILTGEGRASMVFSRAAPSE